MKVTIDMTEFKAKLLDEILEVYSANDSMEALCDVVSEAAMTIVWIEEFVEYGREKDVYEEDN